MRQVAAYNKLLQCMAALGKADLAEELVQMMSANNVTMNAGTFMALLVLYTRIGSSKKLRVLLGEAHRLGLGIPAEVRSAALKAIHDDLAAARSNLLQAIGDRNNAAFASALLRFRDGGHKVPPKLVNAVLTRLLNAEAYENVEAIFKGAQQGYIYLDAESFKMIKLAYVKGNRAERIAEVFQAEAKQTPQIPLAAEEE